MGGPQIGDAVHDPAVAMLSIGIPITQVTQVTQVTQYLGHSNAATTFLPMVDFHTGHLTEAAEALDFVKLRARARVL